MRIDKKKESPDFLHKWPRLVLVLVLVLMGITYVPRFFESKDIDSYYCGAERFEENHFVSSSAKFSTNCKTSQTQKFKGKSSCLCSEDRRYGMTLELDKLNDGDTLSISFMHISKKCKTKLVISSDKDHYYAFPKSGESSDQWEKIEYQFIVPSKSNGAKWRVYPFRAEGDGPAYYDELFVEVKKNDKSSKVERFSQLELQINDQNFKKIRRKREEALEQGLLFSSKLDLVPANLRIDSTVIDAQVRLKGDLLDHLRGDKWSFRIILEGAETWKGMKVFSIHNSKSRSHIAEWFMHKMMEDEGIMTPEYDFFRFILNNREVGVYAYEQHFDNYMLSKNNKLVGPIIRHNDDGYWNNVQGKLKDYDWVVSSQIELFNKENDGDKDFMALYNYGHSMLNSFLNGNKEAEEVFDLDKMARYYALIEAGHGTHAQLITNIRFYVDPRTAKLEPIGYDFYGESLPNITEHWRPVGQWENGDRIYERSKTGEPYKHRLFADLDFFKKYMFYLERYTEQFYLNSKFEKYKNDIKRRVDLLREDKDYKHYDYILEKQFRKAPYTNAKIYPLENVSLRSFRTLDRNEILLQNFHYFPLEVIGYQMKDKDFLLDSVLILKPFSPESSVDYYKMKCKGKPDKVIFKTLGLDSNFYQNIGNVIKPSENTVSQSEYYRPLRAHSQVDLVDGVIRVKGNELIIREPLSVDSDETLEVHGGCVIKLLDRGSLTLNGKVTFVGTKNSSIQIVGEGKRGQGILVSNDFENIFVNTIFSQLGPYGVGVIQKEAGVNIFDTKVYFEDCQWIKNNSKKDLLIANSEFRMTGSSFLDNSGTAMVAFYSTGEMQNINAINYGGDFINIYGGKLSGENWWLKNILSKGVEIQEFGHLNLKKLNISDSHIGLVVKDHSEVSISNYSSKEVTRDYEVYDAQKPPSRLYMTGFGNYNKRKFFVEEGVFCKVNGSHQKMK